MGERRLENGMGDHNGVPRRSSIGRCAVASAVRCRSMIHCPARPSPLGWKRLMGKTGLHCGARCGDIAVLVSVLKPFLFRLSLFFALCGTRNADFSLQADGESSATLGLLLNAHVIILGAFSFLETETKSSWGAACGRWCTSTWISFAFVADPMLCQLPACRPAALPPCFRKRGAVQILHSRGRHRLPTEGEQQSRAGREYGPLLARWCRPGESTSLDPWTREGHHTRLIFRLARGAIVDFGPSNSSQLGIAGPPLAVQGFVVSRGSYPTLPRRQPETDRRSGGGSCVHKGKKPHTHQPASKAGTQCLRGGEFGRLDAHAE